MYRAELRILNTSIGAALAQTNDRETKAHLEAARDQIAKILDPKFAPPANNTSGAIIRTGLDDSCWPAYVILP